MTLVELLCAAYVSLLLPNADIACENMETIVEASEQHAVDPAVMVSLIYVESRWKPTAVSSAGACGLTQVLPKYSAGTRGRFGKRLTCRQLMNPTTSIDRGTQILGDFLKIYDEKYSRSHCAYNAGLSRCKRARGKHKGYRYARKVTKLARKIDREMKEIQIEYENEVDVPGCYE